MRPWRLQPLLPWLRLTRVQRRHTVARRAVRWIVEVVGGAAAKRGVAATTAAGEERRRVEHRKSETKQTASQPRIRCRWRRMERRGAENKEACRQAERTRRRPCNRVIVAAAAAGPAALVLHSPARTSRRAARLIHRWHRGDAVGGHSRSMRRGPSRVCELATNCFTRSQCDSRPTNRRTAAVTSDPPPTPTIASSQRTEPLTQQHCSHSLICCALPTLPHHQPHSSHLHLLPSAPVEAQQQQQ